MTTDTIIEANKRIALEFLAASAIHDPAVVDRLMTEDSTYWVAGKPHLFPYAGVQTKTQIVAYMATPSIFPAGLKQTIGAVTAEADRVAVEVEVDGLTAAGRHYNNFYHYLFTFRGGRISGIKEYVDSYHAAEIFQGKA